MAASARTTIRMMIGRLERVADFPDESAGFPVS